MKSILFAISMAVLMLGCGREPAVAIPELGDRVLTVDEFVARPDLRNKVSALCRNDPGRMGATPNCVNVRRADHIASMGTADKLRLDLTR
ncbi:EexN family lipoprotein [Massilia sp. GER05]|uniref:EexN family lipoprotein n=1 Tax=Massilia sp. GER05 TaxID=3394605 RepID=UPI003F8797AE